MKEYNVNSLLSNVQILHIKDDDGKIVKELRFRKLSANRTFEIAEKYNELMKLSEDTGTDGTDVTHTQKRFSKMLDVCFDIVRPLKLIDRIKNRLSKDYISKKWLMDNFDVDGLNQFMTKILEPIIGDSEKKM
jgi:hypothetical protein